MTRLRCPQPSVPACLLLLALCPGCWGPGSAPKTIKVSGRVTCQGEPVTVGKIVFHPLEPAEGYPSRPATGQLQSDGSYELSTFDPGDGVVPGEYGVSIASLMSGPSPDNPHAPKVWAVPRKYTSPLTSGQTASIPADAEGPLQIDFDLEP